MAEKKFVRAGQIRTATTRRREVELRFAGYREVSNEDVKTMTLDASDPETTAAFNDAVEADRWETNGGAVAMDEESNTALGGPPRPRPTRNKN